MMFAHIYRDPYSTLARRGLKAAVWTAATLVVLAARAPAATRPGDPRLRAELTRLLREDSPAAAVRYAQAALRQNPASADVRHEYVLLHLALARDWLAARRYDACMTALEAVLALDPRHEVALRLKAEIDAARSRASHLADRLDDLERLELFEAALERVKELKALQPELADRLVPREQAAWLGTADDHYLAANFDEAFALYEHVLALDPNAPADIRSRWGISLALALGESDRAEPLDADASGRLLARTLDVLQGTSSPVVAQVVGGLLAERGGELPEAGRRYADALGKPWELPPVDRRAEAVAALHVQAVHRVRELYETTPTRRRDGAWAIVLPSVWKQRTTAHFDVFARNDLVAERVAETLEYHYPRLAGWLGVSPAPAWEPRLEVRVHATRSVLQNATETKGVTSAVSHTRLQDQRVLLRKLEVFQADPWLLSATLPHELTHALLIDAFHEATPPLAVDEGLAFQAEPPARRLRYRRLLTGRPPEPASLLAVHQAPAEPERFYAQADALTSWLLDRQGHQLSTTSQPAPIPALIAALRAPASAASTQPARWWEGLGWQTEGDAQAGWQAWFAARRNPPRMPLMILAAPSSAPRNDAREGNAAPPTP